MSYSDKTLLNYLAEAVQTRGSQPFVFFRGRRISYSRLSEVSDAFAAGLGSLGILSGDRVAVALPNCPQLMVVEVGAWRAGTVLCPFDPTHPLRETAEILAATGAETVVVSNRYYDRIKALQSRTAVRRVITVNIKDDLPPAGRLAYTLLHERKEGDRIDLDSDDVRMTDLLAAHPYAWPPAIGVSPESPAVYLVSHNASGTPTIIVHTHRCLVAAGLELQSSLGSVVAADDVIMLPLPLFHAGATALQSLAFVNHSAIALVTDSDDVTDMLKDIERTRPGLLNAVPTLLAGIMNHPRAQTGKADFRSIKLTLSGTVPPAPTKQRWEALTGGVIRAHG